MPRHPAVSPFTRSLSVNVFGALAQHAKRLGRPYFPLHVGDTYLEPPACAQAEAQLTAEHPHLHSYAPPAGVPELLAAVQRKLARSSGLTRPLQELQITSGATAGLGVVCASLLSPGDEVLLPSPYWPLIRGIVATRGAVPVEVPLFHRANDENFDPVQALAQAVTPRTAAIYLNNPNNPTGTILNEDQLRRIGDLAVQHNLWILCDEVYEDLVYEDPVNQARTPSHMFAMPEYTDRVIANHSVSKAYGLAGARIGYMHGPAAAMKTIRAVQTFYTYCAPKPLQLGAARALDEADTWLTNARNQYQAAANSTAQTLGVPPPPSGTFLFFDARPHFRAHEDIQGFLVRCLEAGLMLTPGSACGRDFENWARLCFSVVCPDDLKSALGDLAGALEIK